MRRITDFLRSHTRGTVITAVGLVVALGGGIAAAALTSGPSSNAAATAAPTTSTTVPATPGRGSAAAGSHARARHVVRGTVTAIGPTSWTIKTAAGLPVTIQISSSTHFGPRVVPSRIAVGDDVVVAGVRSGATVTAARIRLASLSGAARSSGSSAPTSTTAPPTAAAGGSSG